jgi:hypothetical protein
MTTTAFPASGPSDSLTTQPSAPLKSLLDRYGIGLLGESAACAACSTMTARRPSAKSRC